MGQPALSPKHLQAPAPAPLEDLRARLRRAFGRRPRPSLGALDRLVLGLAGADGAGGERAAEALKRGFRPWSRLAKAQPELVAAALRPLETDLGRALARAERLVGGVRRLIARSGGTSLDFLAALPAQEAQAWVQDALALPDELAVKVLTAPPLRLRVAWLQPQGLRVLARLGFEGISAAVDLAGAAPQAWTGEDLGELCALLEALADAACLQTRPDCGPCPVRALCRHARSFPEQNTNTGGDPSFLRRRLARLEGREEDMPHPGLRLGGSAFDQESLPRGLTPGTHQAAAAGPQQGAAPLILPLATAAAVSRPAGGKAGAGVRLLVVQEADALFEHGELFAPGLKALGLDPSSAAFVRVGSGVEALRVIDEALKLKAAPVIAAELRRGEGAADLAASRRLGLSARRAGVWLWLITPDLLNTSAALTRWRVGAAPSAPPSSGFGRRRLGAPAFTLDLVRNRQGPTGAWTLQWDVHEHRFLDPRAPARPAEPPRLRPLPASAVSPPFDRPAVVEAAGRAAA